MTIVPQKGPIPNTGAARRLLSATAFLTGGAGNDHQPRAPYKNFTREAAGSSGTARASMPEKTPGQVCSLTRSPVLSKV
jgi:hypothetical protein